MLDIDAIDGLSRTWDEEKIVGRSNDQLESIPALAKSGQIVLGANKIHKIFPAVININYHLEIDREEERNPENKIILNQIEILFVFYTPPDASD